MGEQMYFLSVDISRIINGRRHRWASLWFTPQFWALLSYRLHRGLYLELGASWRVMRLLASPVAWLFTPWLGRFDISYRADIGPGLSILHPALGVVVSGSAVVGRNLTLTGGNCIGLTRPGRVTLGDDVELGANACVIGPLDLGSDVRVGAGAVVVRDHPGSANLVGVPARPSSIDR